MCVCAYDNIVYYIKFIIEYTITLLLHNELLMNSYL